MKTIPISNTELKAILNGEKFVEDEGKQVLGVGLSALFLFKEGYKKKDAVCRCVEECLTLMRPHLRWQSAEKKQIDLTARDPISPLELHGYGDEMIDGWWSSYSSGPTSTEAAAFEVSFVCRAKWAPVGVSHFEIQLPLSYLNGDFIGMFHRFASELRVHQAYAGIGVFQNYHATYSNSEYYRSAYELGAHYPALEIFTVAAVSESLSLTNRMRSVNWLTAVGNEFVEQLGGTEKLRSGLSPEILVYRYEGGVIFQAGAKPIIDEDEIPPLYREVARALKPVRITEADKSYFDKDTLRWLARFD